MRPRVLTVGPLPPEWGGPRPGGVATFHRALIEHAACDVSTIAEAVGAPVPVLCPPERGEQRWYAEQSSRFDAVLMLHVAHRWAIYHARERPAPAVGAVASWTPMLSRSAEEADKMRQRIALALAGMDALVFPSDHARRLGERLGFAYPAPVSVIPNPLAALFVEPADVNRPRAGVVFAGTRAKNPDLVEEACRRLGISCMFLIGRPQAEVHHALLRAEALCVPSTSESFGNVYAEAIACGTPAIGFGPTLAEISDAAGTEVGVGIVDPDADTVTAALADVLSRRWDRSRLRDAAVKAFEPGAIAGRYADLLRAVRRS